jgi:ribonuclease VapC
MEIKLVNVPPETARIALDAFVRYGKGRHPARLNFGDCFAYACARHLGEPLMFKGGDFPQTDIEAA